MTLSPRCAGACTNLEPVPFTFAFQPIVDVRDGSIFSYEALVRGPSDESAAWVLGQVTDENRYAFDQACRVKALTLATQLGVTTRLNINFLPNAIYEPARCISSTLAAASRLDFPLDRIVFEVAEHENIGDRRKLLEIFAEYHRLGFQTAIDDFGAGYAGLGLLAEFQPTYVKIDMQLVRDIDKSYAKQRIVRAIGAMCSDLNVTVIAEGIETLQELEVLQASGIHLLQGFLFARPAFEALPDVAFSSALRA